MVKLYDALKEKGLSGREIEISQLVSCGMSNREISNRLFIVEKTVKSHLTSIYKKLDVGSRAQLIVLCLPFMDFDETRSIPEIDEASEKAAIESALNHGEPETMRFPNGLPEVLLFPYGSEESVAVEKSEPTKTAIENKLPVGKQKIFE